LTDNLKKQIVDTDLASAKFINLYSILCNERFILEFLEEVVKEKYDNYDYNIKESDFSAEEIQKIIKNQSIFFLCTIFLNEILYFFRKDGQSS